jgi:hypothetical protein
VPVIAVVCTSLVRRELTIAANNKVPSKSKKKAIASRSEGETEVESANNSAAWGEKRKATQNAIIQAAKDKTSLMNPRDRLIRPDTEIIPMIK